MHRKNCISNLSVIGDNAPNLENLSVFHLPGQQNHLRVGRFFFFQFFSFFLNNSLSAFRFTSFIYLLFHVPPHNRITSWYHHSTNCIFNRTCSIVIQLLKNQFFERKGYCYCNNQFTITTNEFHVTFTYLQIVFYFSLGPKERSAVRKIRNLFKYIHSYSFFSWKILE